jgi:hypothetical protein
MSATKKRSRTARQQAAADAAAPPAVRHAAGASSAAADRDIELRVVAADIATVVAYAACRAFCERLFRDAALRQQLAVIASPPPATMDDVSGLLMRPGRLLLVFRPHWAPQLSEGDDAAKADAARAFRDVQRLVEGLMRRHGDASPLSSVALQYYDAGCAAVPTPRRRHASHGGDRRRRRQSADGVDRRPVGQPAGPHRGRRGGGVVPWRTVRAADAARRRCVRRAAVQHRAAARGRRRRPAPEGFPQRPPSVNVPASSPSVPNGALPPPPPPPPFGSDRVTVACRGLDLPALLCNGSETVATLKLRIQAHTGVPPHGQQLSVKGQLLLDDSRTLTECKIATASAATAPQPAVVELSFLCGPEKVFVRTLTGKCFTVGVFMSERVAVLKRRVQDAEGSDMQRLVFAGRQLEDGRSLAECSLYGECTMHLIGRLRGD